MRTQYYIHILVCAMMFADITNISAQTENTGALTGDSIPYGHFEDERDVRDSAKITKINKASQKGEKSAMEYVMDKRYLNIGESFDKKWYKNLYLEAGAGIEQMVPPVDGYRVNPLTTTRFGMGWQFSRLGSIRVTGVCGWGFHHQKKDLFSTLGLKADYIFSLSSYLYGYNPSRPLNVSAVIGAGARKSWLDPSHRNGISYNVNLGVQAKMYTGPHGYIAIEPYVTLGTDKMDLSEYRNWRKIDVSYGATLNYIYYINNILSRESRERIIKSIVDNDALLNNSTPKKWALPWFLEFSNGITFSTVSGMDFSETAGMATTVSVGKWLSPVMGIKASGVLMSNRCGTKTIGGTDNIPQTYTANFHSIYGGARLEAMLNPFGGLKNFRWDNKFGMYLVAGGELGKIKKYDSGNNCYMISYTGGVNLWGRLGQGLMVFVEPRYALAEYKLKSRKVSYDDRLTVNLGLRLQNQGFRTDKNLVADDNMPEERFSIGLGGGMNFKLTNKSYKPLLSYNGRLFADYMITGKSGVEVALERVCLANRESAQYLDCGYEQGKYTKTRKTGMADYRYNYGLLSVDYLVNISRLFSGETGSRPLFELQMLLGPNVAFGLWNNCELADEENLKPDHTAVIANKPKAKTMFGFNGGLKLKCNVSPQISVFFAPTLYWMGKKDIQSLDMIKFKHLETMNVGMQFNLSRNRKAHDINSILDGKSSLNDSTYRRLTNPWFMEFSNGISFCSAPRMDFAKTAGTETNISIGKWLSPVFGFRASGVMRSTRCAAEITTAKDEQSPAYTAYHHSIYGGARLEAMFNPLGYNKNFSWDNKFGMYLIAGGELGKIKKYDSGLGRHALSYTGGINLWGRLGQGLMVFVEPRYTYTEYDIKSSKVLSDNILTMNVGLRLQNHGLKTRKKHFTGYDEPESRLEVGIGGGMNLKLTNKSYKSLLNLNGRLFADYMITKTSGVEVAFECAALTNRAYSQYRDCTIENNKFIGKRKTGMADYRYSYGLLSVDYLINMSRLFCGTLESRPLFELQMLIGPNVAFGLGTSWELASEENLQPNHTAEPITKMKTETSLGFNGGLKLKCNVSPKLSVFFAPTLYWMGKKDMKNLNMIKFKYLETMNVGVQYYL